MIQRKIRFQPRGYYIERKSSWSKLIHQETYIHNYTYESLRTVYQNKSWERDLSTYPGAVASIRIFSNGMNFRCLYIYIYICLFIYLSIYLYIYTHTHIPVLFCALSLYSSRCCTASIPILRPFPFCPGPDSAMPPNGHWTLRCCCHPHG